MTCTVGTCALPAFCRPFLVVEQGAAELAGEPLRLELPLLLCCRHARRGGVDAFFSPGALRRLSRTLRAQGWTALDWSTARIELEWSPSVLFGAEPVASHA